MSAGDTIRIGPNSVSFSSPSANAEINSVNANTIKTASYNAMSPTPGGSNTISVSDKDIHAFKRRIVGRVLSQSGLKLIEDRILRHVNDFVAYLGSPSDHEGHSQLESEEDWGPLVDVPSACKFMTFNLVTDLCYNQNIDLFRSSEMCWIPRAVTLVSRLVVTVSKQG